MPLNWRWRLWAIWLISLEPASAVSLVNGALGDSVHFHQFVYWNAPLEWRFGAFGEDAVVAVRPFYGAPYCYPHYKGRCELSSEGALRLNNLTYADQGQYVFIVGAIEPYPSQIVYYQLHIYPPLSVPVLILNSAREFLVSGRNVTLHCEAGNQNITTYIFYRDGKNICSEPHVTCRDSHLYIHPITEGDNGRYTCTIQNLFSSNTSNTLQLNISATLTAPALVPRSARNHLNGTYVSLHCDAGKQNVAIYTFYRDGKDICSERHVTCKDSHLYFQSISQIDSGRYTCTIQNPTSSSISNILRLSLSTPASAVELTSNLTGWAWEGETVSLYCSTNVTGALYTWHVDGGLLDNNDRYHIAIDPSELNSTLTISPVFSNDTRTYTCLITSPTVNETSNALNLSVAKSPESSNIYCGEEAYNGGVVLICSWAGGQPAAEIELLFNGTTDNGQNMVNRNVSVSNEVQQPVLTCRGNQVGKTSECNKTFERPVSSNHNNDARSSVTEGENATLTVSLTSQNSLIAEFSWFHLNPNAVNITSNGKYKVQSNGSQSTLLITSVTGSESGTYECTARNVIGSTTFKFNLDVKSQGSSGLSGGAIAGIVIGVLAGVALIGVGVFFLVKKLK
ncbi:cell adhesion molecule CEACAM1 [Mantella aurantiaca]